MTSDQPIPGEGVVSGRAARRLGARWAIATGATIVILAAVAALIFAAQRPSASPILPYVPGNAIAYAEARLDTPGDQGQALASFLAHFPGFADTSNLQVKLGDTWDRLVAGLTGNRYRYSTDVEPWAEGTVGVAVLPAPGRREPGVVVLAAVKDQARAQAELDKVVASVARRGTRVEVGGTTAWTMDNGQAVLALLPSGMFVIASDTGTVGAVADARAGKTANLGAAQAYLDASAGSASDRLGSVYISTSAVGSQLRSLMPSIAPTVTACGGTADPLAALPVSMFGTLRAEQDGVVVDVRVRPSPGVAAPTAHASTLVDHVPATTLAYVEVHDLGKALSGGICGLKAGMASSASRLPGASSAPVDQQVQQIEGLLGGPLESFVSWMGDGGIAVGAPLADQSTPSVVFVASAADVSAATQRLAQLKGLLELAGSFGGARGLAVSDVRHGAATITTLTVPTSVAVGGSSGTSLPPSVSVSWTLSGGVFVLALSPGAVARVLDLQSAQSLGATPAFRDALAAAGGPSVTSIAYVDLRATRATAEAAAGLPSTYATDVKPYLLPLDRFVAAGTVQDGVPVIRAVVTVSNPQ